MMRLAVWTSGKKWMFVQGVRAQVLAAGAAVRPL